MKQGVPPTEQRNPQSAGLDLLETRDLVDLLVRDQSEAVAVVRAQAATLARVVEATVERVKRGGRVHYVGAGTSGRLGVLDASEMPPTFGTPSALVCAHIAGGDRALREAIEGAEDDGAAGERAMDEHVQPDDVVLGISASGGARFVIAALERARKIGALTVAITSSDASALVAAAALAIVLPTGPEVLSGSTRLKAGTAQKITLNTLSTAVMVRLGRVHDNLMIDVVATNEKLRGRAERLVRELTGAGDVQISAALERGRRQRKSRGRHDRSRRRCGACTLATANGVLAIVALKLLLAAAIVFVPLDNRSVTWHLPVMLGQIAGRSVVAPPQTLLGNNLQSGEPDAIIAWLNSRAPRTNTFVLSSDMLAYGGLIASRVPGPSYADAYARLREIDHLRARYNRAWIGVFGTVMRLAPTGVPAGTPFFAPYPVWSYLQQYANLHDPLQPDELEEAQRLRGLIGDDVLNAYLADACAQLRRRSPVAR